MSEEECLRRNNAADAVRAVDRRRAPAEGVTVQIKTQNGTTWARWIDNGAPPVIRTPPGTRASGASCAHCRANDPTWRTIPDPEVMPRGQLMYECHTP